MNPEVDITSITTSHDHLGHARSPKWHEVEKAHLTREPFCRYCGGQVLLQVHHKMPFHLDPAKELDPTNLITLCEDYHDGVECHLHVGHLGNWKHYNPDVETTANSTGPGIKASTLSHANTAA